MQFLCTFDEYCRGNPFEFPGNICEFKAVQPLLRQL